ncbi:tautomerase family protein [Neorhizobium tomejilense]|uniref:tautomerase family protein n=1 Tax=Neorhizobium tomejilense TaxID=2093828 RepID=UPI001FDF6EA7|nr:tautomerase family protein [Neorhizobium tomejilense]
MKSDGAVESAHPTVCFSLEPTLLFILRRLLGADDPGGLHERLAMRHVDVFIPLVEVKRENRSFGNGEAQYA